MNSKRLQWQKLKKIHLRLFSDLPAEEFRITIPTIFTFIRFLLVPCVTLSMVFHYWGAAFIFFLSATITDFLDGNLARIMHEKTFLGACLDPIADKLLLISFFFTLVFLKTPLIPVPLWFVLLVLCKELIVVCGAMYILLSGRHLDVRPTLLGKLTTVVQMLFIIWLFTCYYFHWMPVKTYYLMLILMLTLVLFSCIQYVRIGYKQL